MCGYMSLTRLASVVYGPWHLAINGEWWVFGRWFFRSDGRAISLIVVYHHVSSMARDTLASWMMKHWRYKYCPDPSLNANLERVFLLLGMCRTSSWRFQHGKCSTAMNLLYGCQLAIFMISFNRGAIPQSLPGDSAKRDIWKHLAAGRKKLRADKKVLHV